jgi:major cell surface glycoprotein (TIGR04216 family)
MHRKLRTGSTVLLLSVLIAGGLAVGATLATGAASAQATTPGESSSSIVFAPGVFADIGGQVATEDGEVNVGGTARGFEEVLVTMIDRRGRIASDVVTVDDDDGFEDDVALRTPDGESLSEGPIVATVFAAGRDGVVGDGEIAGFTRADLDALDENTRERAREEIQNQSVTRTAQQVLALFYEESINDTGSDDQVLFDAFRYADGRTSIETVGPQVSPNRTGSGPVVPGETVVVSGRTNRKPVDNTITVEVIDGPTPLAFDLVSTDQWGTDGTWSVTLDVPAGVEAGNYTLRSDDGDSTDTGQVEVLSAPVPGNETTANRTVSNASVATEPVGNETVSNETANTETATDATVANTP